jgi:hypothetical protein
LRSRDTGIEIGFPFRSDFESALVLIEELASIVESQDARMKSLEERERYLTCKAGKTS